jgi:hypothetical protein
MKDEPAGPDFERVSALIEKEEEDGLAFFRARDFRQGIERRLEAAAGRNARASLLRTRAVPVLAAVLVAVLAGASFFLLRRPAARRAPEFKTLASALAQLPGLSPSPGWEPPVPAEKAGTFRVAEAVRQALVKAEQSKREEGKSFSVPMDKGEVPRLSLDEKMEILFQEKVIERALLLFSTDSKEV